MKIRQTALPGVVIIETTKFLDRRGSFSRLYCEDELSQVIGDRHIVQINHSSTDNIGTVRGLHYQRSPYMEMKLVRCLKGRVWDVAVDLRKDSPTFLQWHAEELSPQNTKMLVIPEGCAHGFQILEAKTELLYLHTESYMPAAEAGLRVDDPRLSISWPLPIAGLSERDSQHPAITMDFTGLLL
jgi:dTDP-4-dehydrorhamnose 3,5-epimerase